jgi:hypothetical protein
MYCPRAARTGATRILLRSATNDPSAVKVDFLRQGKFPIVAPGLAAPGFAFGGSCPPKDVRALTYQGRLLEVETRRSSDRSSRAARSTSLMPCDPADGSAAVGTVRPKLQGREPMTCATAR